MVAVSWVMETAIAGTVKVAELEPSGSETEVAVMVTVRSSAGGVAGALYVTEVPVTLIRVPAPDTGERVQVTPLLAGSGLTVAVNDCVLPASTGRGLAGVMETTTVGTVMVTEADFDASVTEVAVIVTVRPLAGGVAGALYVTEELVILIRLPAPDAGEMVQATPWPDGSSSTLALIGTIPPACTVAVVGETDTLIAATVTVAALDLEVSATEVALMVTVKSLEGGVLGAV